MGDNRRVRRGSLTLLLVLLSVLAGAAEQITLRMMAGAGYGIPPKEATDPRSVARRAVFEEFHRRNPDIRVVNAGGLEVTGERAESMFLMSMAGSTPPDVFYVNFRQYYNYIDQGFCRPLNDLVAQDPWVMDRLSPVVREVIYSFDGEPYAVPFFQVALGLYFRRDYLRDAGLDPAKPPRDWDELYAYCQRIVESNPGRAGFAFSKGPGYHWSNFIFQAGGQVVKIQPNGQTEAAVDSDAGRKAIDFFRKMTSAKWKGKDGKTYGPAAIVSTKFRDDIRDGKVAMWFDYSGDVVTSMGANDLPPSIIGIASMPKGPVNASHEVNAGSWAINADIKDPAKLKACWEFIKFFASDEAARVNTINFVDYGMAAYVNPKWLKKFGFEEYLGEVDPTYVQANEELFQGGHPEPYGKNTQQVYTVLDTALERATLEPGTPSEVILKDAAQEMNSKLLGYIPEERKAQQRAWALGIAVGLGIALTVWFGRSIAKMRRVWLSREKTDGRRRSLGFFLLCLAPAVITLLVWAYVPLARGLLIAFQDYRITKEAQWVGLDNFITVFTSPIFFKSFGNSLLYVGLSIVIGFFIPIFLALALNEIPIGKVLFRTLFYLPAMTSGIVIALLWRQFYDKTELGLLNQLVKPIVEWINFTLIKNPEAFWPLNYDWLGDPKLAMYAVVLPGVWAAAGPGSILYLAALKNIPEERYEAADLDGANWWEKIRRITLPGLKPLMGINLLGVFIGGFKAMENIFVLTMGGPLYSTHTVGLEVWMNAFMFLKFGYATAAAWVMGAFLIGFTMIQIRSLLGMKFTAAKGV